MNKMFEVVSPTGSWVTIDSSPSEVLENLANLGYSKSELESLVVTELPVETISI